MVMQNVFFMLKALNLNLLNVGFLLEARSNCKNCTRKTKCVLPITVTIVVTMIILDADWLTWAKIKVTSSD